MWHEKTPNSFVKMSLFRNNSCLTKTSHWGVISSYDSSNVTVSDCIFLKNKADHTFSASMNGIITIISCFGDILTAGTSIGSCNTNKMKTNSFNLSLSLLSLGKCDAEFLFSFELLLLGSSKKFELLFSMNFSFECVINIISF